MAATWKDALYDYIRQLNQMEMDCYYGRKASIQIIDKFSYNRLLDIVRRVSDRNQSRQAVPLKGISKLAVRQIIFGKGQVQADITLFKQSHYSIKDHPHSEESLALEQVTIDSNNGMWHVSKIEPTVMERTSFVPRTQTSKTLSVTTSIPLLNTRVYPVFYSQPRNQIYDRSKVKQYADLYWNEPNPEFLYFDVDCTNFVSQCILAGGLPMHNTGRRETGWWYQGKKDGQEWWSFSWAVANSLFLYLGGSKPGLNANEVFQPEQLMIGDVILYDWDGDTKFQHSVIVTAHDSNGMPLVNAHTTNSKHRYWDYRDSYAWTKQTRYRFFHIFA